MFRGPNATSERTLPAKIWRSGSWNARPTIAASSATARSAASDAVDEDPALGRAEEAVEVADERRLAAAVLADDRDPLADRRSGSVDAVQPPGSPA